MRRLIVIACLATLVIAAITGGVAYNIGLAQGSEDFRDAHHWHPWHFGHFLGPLIFLFIASMLIRGAFWGGYYRHGRRFGRYGRGDFEEWHRELHERMWNDPKNEGAQPR